MVTDSSPNLQPPDSRHRQSPERLHFYGDNFVFDPIWGMFYRVSAAGAFMLRALASGVARGDLASLLARQYDLSETRAVRDVEIFLDDINALGLIERQKP